MAGPGWREHIIDVFFLSRRVLVAHVIRAASILAHSVTIARRRGLRRIGKTARASTTSLFLSIAAFCAPELRHAPELVLEHLIILVH